MSGPALIITADDFGLCPEVDSGILDLVQMGVVTAVASFVNQLFDRDVQPPSYSNISVGLHLNLTLGRPLCPAGTVSSLVDSDGRFHNDLHRFAETWNPEEASREMAAQLDRFRSWMGKDPAFLNFHKHLADYHPDLFERMLDMAILLDHCPVRVRNSTARSRCRQLGIPTCDHFVGAVCPGGFWTQAVLADAAVQLSSGVTEWMCHPAYRMEPMPGIRYDIDRFVELQAFQSESVRRLLSKVRLGSFDLLTR